jgi:c-di-GMP-binding flagellar brake protein YcgR
MTIRNPSAHDKRSFTRYPSKNSCAVMLTPGHIMSYSILDISKSGMAFCYDGKANESKLLNNVTVTIFSENDIAPDICVQIISDTELDEAKTYHPAENIMHKNRHLRRCGIKFSSLSQSQENMINVYIQNLSAN